MVSLRFSSSRASSIRSSKSQNSLINVPPSPAASNGSSSSSSSEDAGFFDPENVTITPNRPLSKLLNENRRRKSQEDLQLLAVSTHITELGYSISDIQTRIFEIQELRHKSQSSSDSSKASGVIDQSLSQLDERVQSVSTGIKSVGETLQPLLQDAEKAQTAVNAEPSESSMLLRKHSAMMAEWDALQKEIEVLREELKEDKWLTVFRTVTEQADGMMSSLEKAVNRCQEFIWQAHKREDSISQISSSHSEKSSLSLDVFNSLLDSYEAKKKHYMPATSKVLSIIDKGVQDRVTKNGECLRRHAESTQRWKNLKERIARTDIEMEAMRRLLLSLDTPSEAGSSTSAATSKSRSGYLATPSRSPPDNAAALKLSRSMSPFRKLARKLTSSASRSPKDPHVEKQHNLTLAPSSEPSRTLKKRTSMFHFLATPPTPVTPSHKHTQSLTPDTSPSLRRTDSRAESGYGVGMASRTDLSSMLNGGALKKPAWNSSTKVTDDERISTLKLSQRRPSSSGLPRHSGEDVSPIPALYPATRSVSRSSMSSSRPWSPVTSSASTVPSSNPALSLFRPPSRSAGNQTSSGFSAWTRNRSKTPSSFPNPPHPQFRSFSGTPSEAGDYDASPTTIMQRALSPTNSPRSHTPGGSVLPTRPPSRSKIPIPSVHVSSASRPSSAMSNYRPDSSMSFRASAARVRTPDMLRSTPRPSLMQTRMPPSSYKDSPRTPGSRPGSRAGAATPTDDQAYGPGPLHPYRPSNPKDPLDAEVAAVVNSISHGLLIERVDPPLRNIPREGEEIRAQYAFSNQLARKTLTCKLTTLARSGSKGQATKKVMCRVGGGWQDLAVYVMSRQS